MQDKKPFTTKTPSTQRSTKKSQLVMKVLPFLVKLGALGVLVVNDF
jgi:hypothetical protein